MPSTTPPARSFWDSVVERMRLDPAYAAALAEEGVPVPGHSYTDVSTATPQTP